MERLTTNKDVSEMSMYELAHNSCYAKDGRARYRDYDTDIDAREVAKKLLSKYADMQEEFTDDEEFDEYMENYLSYGIDHQILLQKPTFKKNWKIYMKRTIF